MLIIEAKALYFSKTLFRLQSLSCKPVNTAFPVLDLSGVIPQLSFGDLGSNCHTWSEQERPLFSWHWTPLGLMPQTRFLYQKEQRFCRDRWRNPDDEVRRSRNLCWFQVHPNRSRFLVYKFSWLTLCKNQGILVASGRIGRYRLLIFHKK